MEWVFRRAVFPAAFLGIFLNGCTTIQTLPLKEGLPPSVSAPPGGPSLALLPVEEAFEGRPEARAQESDQTFLGKSLYTTMFVGPIPLGTEYDEFHSDVARVEGVRAAVLANLKERGIPADTVAEGGIERLQALPNALLGLSVSVRRLDVRHKLNILIPVPFLVIYRHKIVSAVALDCKVWQSGQAAPLAEATAQASAVWDERDTALWDDENSYAGELANSVKAVVRQCLDKLGLAERLAAAAKEWVPEAQEEGGEFYLRLAQQGNPRAQKKLGARYEKARDYVEAYKWFFLAAASSDSEGRQGMERLRLLMTTEEVAQAEKMAASVKARAQAGAPAP